MTIAVVTGTFAGLALVFWAFLLGMAALVIRLEPTLRPLLDPIAEEHTRLHHPSLYRQTHPEA